MTVNYFSWSDSLILLICERMFARYSSLNKRCLSVVLASKNDVLQNKRTSSAYNPNSCTSILPGTQSLSFCMRQKVLLLPISPYRILRSHKKGQDIIKFNILIKFNKLIIYYFIKNILKWNGFLCGDVCVSVCVCLVVFTVSSWWWRI